MKRSALLVSFLMFGCRMLAAQEPLTSIGLGVAGGMSLNTADGEIGLAFRLSAVLDRFTETYDRITRRQWDLGSWQSEETSDEWYGSRRSERRIVHLSMSYQFLFGGRDFHLMAGFGASLLFISEEEFQEVDEDAKGLWEDSHLQESYISVAFFPLLGFCLAITPSVDIFVETRYDLVAHPVSASGLAVAGGVLFIF